MIIKGNLDVGDSSIESLGNIKEIKGYLDLRNECKNLKDLGNIKYVKELRIGTVLDSFKITNLKIIKGDFYLANSNLKSLGSIKIIQGECQASGSSLIEFGENLIAVYDDIILAYSHELKSFGKGFKKCYGNLSLTKCESLKNLGNIESVGRTLNLTGCKSLTSLNQLKYADKIYIEDCTLLKTLPKDLKVSKNIYIKNSGITKEYMKKEKPDLFESCIWDYWF